jgi:uncharacterized membrane protein
MSGPPQNGMGTAALVMGILGLFLGWIFSLLAIIFGSIGVSKVDRGEADNGPSAQWGRALGWVGLILWVIIIWIVIANT